MIERKPFHGTELEGLELAIVDVEEARHPTTFDYDILLHCVTAHRQSILIIAKGYHPSFIIEGPRYRTSVHLNRLKAYLNDACAKELNRRKGGGGDYVYHLEWMPKRTRNCYYYEAQVDKDTQFIRVYLTSASRIQHVYHAIMAALDKDAPGYHHLGKRSTSSPHKHNLPPLCMKRHYPPEQVYECKEGRHPCPIWQKCVQWRTDARHRMEYIHPSVQSFHYQMLTKKGIKPTQFFLLDKGLTGVSWFRVRANRERCVAHALRDMRDSERAYIGSWQAQFQVDHIHVEALPDIVRLPPYRNLCFDIEVEGLRKGAFPMAKKGDPIIQIGYYLHEGEDVLKAPEAVKRGIFCIGDVDAIEGAEVQTFSEESALLSAFFRLLRRWDPDILSGKHLKRFSQSPSPAPENA